MNVTGLNKARIVASAGVALAAVATGYEVWRSRENKQSRPDRIDQALRGVDPMDAYILVVGGGMFLDPTTPTRHNRTLAGLLDAHLGAVSIVSPDFDTSPMLWRSLPDAEQTMADTVREIAKRWPDKQIVMVGDSLGSWGIERALTHRDVQDAVAAAALVAHPIGVAGSPEAAQDPDASGITVIANRNDVIVGFPQGLARAEFWGTQLRYLGSLAKGLARGDQSAWGYKPHIYSEEMHDVAAWMERRLASDRTVTRYTDRVPE